jgi:hypothetical protein
VSFSAEHIGPCCRDLWLTSPGLLQNLETLIPRLVHRSGVASGGLLTSTLRLGTRMPLYPAVTPPYQTTLLTLSSCRCLSLLLTQVVYFKFDTTAMADTCVGTQQQCRIIEKGTKMQPFGTNEQVESHRLPSRPPWNTGSDLGLSNQ